MTANHLRVYQDGKYVPTRRFMDKALSKTIIYEPDFKGKQGTERALLRCELFKARAMCRAMIIANNQRNE